MSIALPLPSNPTHLRIAYDVVILGSGLCAATVASRLSQKGQRVAVLEPGQHLGHEAGSSGRQSAPTPGLFQAPSWPRALREDEVELTASATRLHEEGASESECVARRLGDAAARGAHLFVNCEPRALARTEDGAWRLTFHLGGVGREGFGGPPLFVKAPWVVVALGTESGPWLKTAGVLHAPALGTTCAMAEHGLTGATNHLGAVFSGEGTATHPGLFVASASLAPATAPAASTSSLAALVGRNVERWSEGEPGAPLPLLPAPAPSADVGLHFTEAMRGFVSPHVKAAGAYESGFRRGKEDGAHLAFVLTLGTDGVEAMSRDPQHAARSVGTVFAPALDPSPLMVAGGDFNLFVEQADGSQRMKYRMQLHGEAGNIYFFDGFKVIRDDPGLDLWPDTTTLHVTIHDGPDADAPVWGRGLLHILPRDFARQLGTFQSFGARNRWQALRAQTSFGRLFLGSLFDTYVNVAPLLPRASQPGSWYKILAAKLGWLTFAFAALLFWIWPWRPPMLRNQPLVHASLASPTASRRDWPEELASLDGFPSIWQGRTSEAQRSRTENLVYQCSWVPDNLVQTHGGLGEIPFHPGDIARFSEPALRRGFVNLTRIRNGEGRVVGIGSQLETVIANRDAVTRRSIDAYTDWTLLFPGKGVLFLGQVEGGPDLATLSNEVSKSQQPWKGRREMNRSLGPLPDGRGIVHAGTGAFRDVFGTFREFNIVTEVPVHGDIVADTRYELTLQHAPLARREVPEPARQLQLPAHCSRGLEPDRPWRLTRRSFLIDWRRDLVYSSMGTGLSGDVVPASLGKLMDPDLARVRVLLAKLRDEHGTVVGLAAASSAQRPDGGGYISQWTLLVSGAGCLYVAPEEPSSPGHDVRAPERGYLGAQRGLIVGGTGSFFETTGALQEHWPEDPNQPIRFDVSLVTDTL